MRTLFVACLALAAAAGGLVQGQAAAATLTVTSSPVTGINIGITPTDVNGAGTGPTNLTRSYNVGTSVTLSAPSFFIKNGVTYNFSLWKLDGINQAAGQRVISFVMNGERQAEAEYQRQEGLLTVKSDPLTGITIQVFPTDLNGQGAGVTNFTRNYAVGTNVSLSAPAVFIKNGITYSLKFWKLDGVNQAAGQRIISFTITGERRAEAEYQQDAGLLTVKSTPVGINIQVFPNDLNGQGVGATNFTRSYAVGTNVTLSAPAVFIKGGVTYNLKFWKLDGVNQPAGQRIISFTITGERQAEAEYEISP